MFCCRIRQRKSELKCSRKNKSSPACVAFSLGQLGLSNSDSTVAVKQRSRKRKQEKKHPDTPGKRIQAARIYIDMAQSRLGESIGVSKCQIRLWETEEQKPAAGYISRLAAELKVTVNCLLGQVGPGTATGLHGGRLRLTPYMQQTPETALQLLETGTD